MEGRTEDMLNMSLGEMTIEEFTPILRNIISDEFSKCSKAMALPADTSGLDGDFAERFYENPRMYVIGMEGLAKFLHCSVRTAYTYLKSGKYDAAIHKFGRKYVIDKKMFEEIHFKTSKFGNRRIRYGNLNK
jgi:hypothetical protein